MENQEEESGGGIKMSGREKVVKMAATEDVIFTIGDAFTVY